MTDVKSPQKTKKKVKFPHLLRVLKDLILTKYKYDIAARKFYVPFTLNEKLANRVIKSAITTQKLLWVKETIRTGTVSKL